MNDRPVVEQGFQVSPAVPAGTHRIGTWTRSIAIVLMVTIIALTMTPTPSVLAKDQASGTDGSSDTGMQVASWLLTVPYCAGKSAFAIAGSVVGGLGYAFSGGNARAAESVWTASVYGTYILRPAHLRGEEPIHFIGTPDDRRSVASAPPAKRSEQSRRGGSQARG